MKVPFRLQRVAAADSVRALFLPGHDVPVLLALCARLGTMPVIHTTADGFLLKLRQPVTAAAPGVIRLRGLAEDLFLPADAELVPALRPDEAAGLVRDRGLVFLPGDRVLTFAPAQPLTLPALLRVGSVRRRAWQSLPEAPPLADRLRTIVLDLPDESAEAVLNAGASDIGTEAPRPADAAPGTRLLGQAKLTAGQHLMRLGEALGLKRLTQLGAEWVKSAVTQVPRLSEGVLGQQEAALRDLLREFREGDLERALRRALPLGGAGDRGGQPSRGTHLPVNDTRYSLRNLLGAGGGAAGIWFGGYDVQRELMAEYRKAAEQALRRGDYRRAAFIYGKLLRDYRMAANALRQGGLFHDAAVLYLEKVGDTLAAAQAFESAGEIDRAVQLYQQRGDHLAAADLLRRAGEEEAALVEYRAAADRLLLSPRGYLAAGELLLTRAGRRDLAREYFARGWGLRPEANAVPCALQLAELLAQEESPGPRCPRAGAAGLLALLGEAETFFASPGEEVSASQFYNTVARLAERDNLAGVRAELRDRALLGLAVKLRQHAAAEVRPGDSVSALLGRSGAWGPVVVTDAQFALQAALKHARPSAPAQPVQRNSAIRVGRGVVTAACFAPRVGAVFLGFANGDVARFEPLSSSVVSLPARRAEGEAAAVTSLATDGAADLVVATHGLAPKQTPTVSSYRRVSGGDYREVEWRPVTISEPLWLSPFIPAGEDYLVGLWQDGELRLLRGPLLSPQGGIPARARAVEPTTALVLRSPPLFGPPLTHVVLLFGEQGVWFWAGGSLAERAHLGWTPSPPPGRRLWVAPLAWLARDPTHLEVAGLHGDGNACWSLLRFREDGGPLCLTTNITRAGTYQAVTLVRPGLVAAVGRFRIDWLRGGTNGFSYWSASHVTLPAVVACFPSYETRELIVVCLDGLVVRLPVPN